MMIVACVCMKGHRYTITPPHWFCSSSFFHLCVYYSIVFLFRLTLSLWKRHSSASTTFCNVPFCSDSNAHVLFMLVQEFELFARSYHCIYFRRCFFCYNHFEASFFSSFYVISFVLLVLMITSLVLTLVIHFIHFYCVYCSMTPTLATLKHSCIRKECFKFLKYSPLTLHKFTLYVIWICWQKWKNKYKCAAIIFWDTDNERSHDSQQQRNRRNVLRTKRNWCQNQIYLPFLRGACYCSKVSITRGFEKINWNCQKSNFQLILSHSHLF